MHIWQERLINALVRRYEASSLAEYYAACDELVRLRRAVGLACYVGMWIPDDNGPTTDDELYF